MEKAECAASRMKLSNSGFWRNKRKLKHIMHYTSKGAFLFSSANHTFPSLHFVISHFKVKLENLKRLRVNTEQTCNVCVVPNCLVHDVQFSMWLPRLSSSCDPITVKIVYLCPHTQTWRAEISTVSLPRLVRLIQCRCSAVCEHHGFPFSYREYGGKTEVPNCRPCVALNSKYWGLLTVSQ